MLADTVSLEAPRQEGRPWSLSAMTAPGQSRVQKRIGPIAAAGQGSPAGWAAAIRPGGHGAVERDVVGEAEPCPMASRPSAATCEQSVGLEELAVRELAAQRPVTVDLPVPLAPVTTNSGRSGTCSSSPHRGQRSTPCRGVRPRHQGRSSCRTVPGAAGWSWSIRQARGPGTGGPGTRVSYGSHAGHPAVQGLPVARFPGRARARRARAPVPGRRALGWLNVLVYCRAVLTRNEPHPMAMRSGSSDFTGWRAGQQNLLAGMAACRLAGWNLIRGRQAGRSRGTRRSSGHRTGVCRCS